MMLFHSKNAGRKGRNTQTDQAGMATARQRHHDSRVLIVRYR
jgi:hypothetical protein